MEESSRRNADNMQQINTNIANITGTIQDGFALMRELLVQPHNAHPHSSSGGYGQFQGHSSSAFMHRGPHPTTPAFIHPLNETNHSGRYTPTMTHDPPQEQTSSYSYRQALFEDE